jgi:hypothetical protein
MHDDSRLDCSDAANAYEELYNKIHRLQAVVDMLDKTKDGVYVTPGMIVYHPDHLHNRTLYSQLFIPKNEIAHSGDCNFHATISDCYSTWELAAQAAKDAEKEEADYNNDLFRKGRMK